MTKKLLIVVLALTFLLTACLKSETVIVDSEAGQPVATEPVLQEDESSMQDEIVPTETPVEEEDHGDMEDASEAEDMSMAEEEDDADAMTEEMTEEMTPTPEPEVVQVGYDFPIEPYQGFDIDSPLLSDVFQGGNPSVVNFFASGCPICVLEMDHLENAYQEFGDRVNFVAIDVGSYVGLGTEQGAIDLLADKNASFPAGNTPDIQVLREYNVLGTPTTVFFNSDGSISEIYTGLLSYDQFVTYIDALN